MRREVQEARRIKMLHESSKVKASCLGCIRNINNIIMLSLVSRSKYGYGWRVTI